MIEAVWFIADDGVVLRQIEGRPRTYRVAEFEDALRVDSSVAVRRPPACRTREFHRIDIHLPSGRTKTIYIEDA